MRAALLAVALVAISSARADYNIPPMVPGVLALDRLGPASPAGQIFYVTDCRAIIPSLLGTLITQGAGSGTGCLATSNGTVWQIAGTTALVTK